MKIEAGIGVLVETHAEYKEFLTVHMKSPKKVIIKKLYEILGYYYTLLTKYKNTTEARLEALESPYDGS
jgi:hypothetical protein